MRQNEYVRVKGNKETRGKIVQKKIINYLADDENKIKKVITIVWLKVL